MDRHGPPLQLQLRHSGQGQPILRKATPQEIRDAFVIRERLNRCSEAQHAYLFRPWDCKLGSEEEQRLGDALVAARKHFLEPMPHWPKPTRRVGETEWTHAQSIQDLANSVRPHHIEALDRGEEAWEWE